MKTKGIILPALLAIMALSCKQPIQEVVEVTKVEKAVCELHPTEGNETSGMISFTKTDSGIVVNAEVNGLTPGKHGFHIHQYGDCSSPDGTSAGGHFNPHDVDHAGPHDEVRHVGDLGNLDADSTGYAKLEYLDTKITFEGQNSIIGRGVIVHAGEDDLTSQPTGAAGARVACGVIGIVQEN
ncbi:MAG: superoxide dismutase family protein [Bacteroidetes bacterium]|jgi:Cu-Zn family superoxide dismutase|nr:superoxide dismutase family protein [Bacteroidota bacterium]